MNGYIRADAAQLEREMQRVNGITRQTTDEMGGAFDRLKGQIAALGPALSLVGFVEFGRRAIDAAGHIVDLSDRIGFAASTLSALETPLLQGGSNLDEFAAAVNRMNNMVGEAAKGSEEAVKAFDALGLSVAKLRTLTPEEQFYEIARALGGLKDQATQTEAGMNIFGRSFAVLLPLLKQYEGDMRKAVEAQEKLGDSLSKEQLDRIDQFGDALSAAGVKAKNSFLEAFYAILKVNDAINEVLIKPGTNAKSGMPGDNSAYRYGPNLPKGYVTTEPGKTVDFAVFKGGEQYGPEMKSSDARGSNADLLGKKDAAQKLATGKKALDDYNLSLKETGVLLRMTEREQAEEEARFKTVEIARRSGIKLTQQQIDDNVKLAVANYDLKQSQDEVNKATAEAARFQQELHDKLSATLTDIVFKAGSAKDAMLGFAESIARAAFEKKVAGPLADAFIGTGGNKGILDDAFSGVGKIFGGFFAEGGNPPVGIPSIVGERGPEIFVPNTAGTIVPNHALGGTTVIVQQTFNMQPGLPETVGAAIQQAAPQIAAMAHNSVFQAMQNGGTESRISGRRS